MLLSSLISKDCVFINPKVNDKNSLIKMMIEGLEASGVVDDSDLLYRDIIAREELSSTALDLCCAIPHAHSDGVKTTVIAVAILSEGIDFNAPDSQNANIVFLIAGPKNMAGFHLKILSKMARLLNDNDFREKLITSGSVENFISLFTKQEE